MPQINVDNLEIPYVVSRRRVRYPRLEFRTGGLVVVMPKGRNSAKDIINRHRFWIKQKQLTISDALHRSKGRKLEKRSLPEIKRLVLAVVEKFRQKYGFEVKRIFFRAMKSKWASHSRNGNLTINSALRLLPKSLVEYVVFHEMAHSIERRHNERFWKIVEKKFKTHQKLENELMIYWFLIQK